MPEPYPTEDIPTIVCPCCGRRIDKVRRYNGVDGKGMLICRDCDSPLTFNYEGEARIIPEKEIEASIQKRPDLKKELEIVLAINARRRGERPEAIKLEIESRIFFHRLFKRVCPNDNP